jgi:chitinase
VTDCPAKIGSVTTEIIPLYTTLCPVTPGPSEAVIAVPTSTAVSKPVVTLKASGTGVAPYQPFTGAASMAKLANVIAVLAAVVVHIVVFF